MIRSLPLLLLLQACAPGTTPGGSPGPGPTPAPDPHDPADVSSLVLHVVYEEGAAPYVGSVGPAQGDTWDLFSANADAMFSASELDVTHPTDLEGMDSFNDDGVSGYDVQALLDLAESVGSPGVAADGTRTIVALWLEGRLLRDGEESDSVLGVSLGDTSVLAMFKPVIRNVGTLDAVKRFGEQAVLVHEFGHAVGLVNNGVDITSDHHDEEHGAHCSNDACVMYWALEGASDMAAFVQQYVLTGSTVIVAQDCLDDLDAHYGD